REKSKSDDGFHHSDSDKDSNHSSHSNMSSSSTTNISSHPLSRNSSVKSDTVARVRPKSSLGMLTEKTKSDSLNLATVAANKQLKADRQAEEARKNRKIADLEISIKSLMKINSELDATNKKQAIEIQDLARRLQINSITNSSSIGSNSRSNVGDGGGARSNNVTCKKQSTPVSIESFKELNLIFDAVIAEFKKEKEALIDINSKLHTRIEEALDDQYEENNARIVKLGQTQNRTINFFNENAEFTKIKDENNELKKVITELEIKKQAKCIQISKELLDEDPIPESGPKAGIKVDAAV
ncbi:20505_t:CDS:2, partial [Entrophospora sp. SA101]